MTENRIGNIAIENAHLIFKNFAGKQTQFNPAGRRNFCVIIDDALANQMIEDGWNIKRLKSRDPEEEPPYYIPVAVSYKVAPPDVFMISGTNKTTIKEDTIDTLDYAEIEHCDVVIRPYNWEVNGKSGLKAYLKTMYVTVYKDAFEDKYASLCSGCPDEDTPF